MRLIERLKSDDGRVVGMWDCYGRHNPRWVKRVMALSEYVERRRGVHGL